MTSPEKEAARRAQIQEIHDGAVTREALGQAARHTRDGDGRHVVTVYDRTAGVLRTWTGANLVDVLARARRPSEIGDEQVAMGAT